MKIMSQMKIMSRIKLRSRIKIKPQRKIISPLSKILICFHLVAPLFSSQVSPYISSHLGSFISPHLNSHLNAQTIAEKLAGTTGGSSDMTPEMQTFLVDLNKEINEKRELLLTLQAEAITLHQAKSPPESFQNLLTQINELRAGIRELQETWRQMAAEPTKGDEGYALFHQPDTTLDQLVVDYGSSDYVYMVNPDIAKLRISINSNIPIPRSSWGEMLEQILLQNGIGIKELNPFLRQLFLVSKDLSNLKIITANASDLNIYPDNARVSFVLTPQPMDVQRVWFFLGKFVNPNTTVLQRISRVILVVGEVSDVKELLKIYDFVLANKSDLEYKTFPLTRVEADEMAEILETIFAEIKDEAPLDQAGAANNLPPFLQNQMQSQTSKKSTASSNNLKVISLPKVAQAVFLIGTREEIKRAEDIIRDVEDQVGEAREKTILWYHVNHTNPEELAQIINKIYLLMIKNRVGQEEIKKKDDLKEEQQLIKDEIAASRPEPGPYGTNVNDPIKYYNPPFYQQGGYVVNPAPAQPRSQKPQEVNKNRDNFIVDPKTGNLVMVVESDLAARLTETLKKLDVPSRMVQIDVLLFEKRLSRNTRYGLNLLRLGDAASQQHISKVFWNDTGNSDNVCGELRPCSNGILEFFFSRLECSWLPAFDLSYKFLMTQDELSISANPSVVTMNQTPAVISIVDDLSISTGFNLTNSNNLPAQQSFQRAQYGITVSVTPTIHVPEGDDPMSDPTSYVNLLNDITIDSIKPGGGSQPEVLRRNVKNEVRVPDGQTVIIGGLRRRDATDTKKQIPFLGEIPGIGKLFSDTDMNTDDTEMIFFITPKIISEPEDDFKKLRRERLCGRPGDIPAFVCRLNESLEREKNRLFAGYMSILFGRPGPRYICEEGEYDGR